MKLRWMLVPLLVSLVLIALPDSVSAAMLGPILPQECHCPGSAPDWGCVMQVIQNTMNIAISLGIIIATIVIAWAGGLWILSPLNPKNREQGRTMLLNAVVGLVIVLSAWLFVDFLMKTLYNPEAGGSDRFGPWNEIILNKTGVGARCLVPHTPPTNFGANNIIDGTDDDNDDDNDADGDTDDDGTVDTADNDDDGDGKCDPGTTATEASPCTGIDNCPLIENPGQEDNNGTADGEGAGDACETPVDTGTSPTGCSNCVRVEVSHKSPAQNGCDLQGGKMGVAAPNPAITECYVNSGLHSKLRSSVQTGWWVTEMWPPTVNHAATCHGNGTCADVADRLDGNPTTAQIIAAANSFKAQGLYVVYEWSSLTTAQCQEIRQATGNSSHVKLMKLGGDPHFSVYLTDSQQSALCQ